MVKNHKNGYSLAEILLVIILISFLFLITFFNIPRLLPDQNKAGFKKGYSNLEIAISALINNYDIYNEVEGFSDTGKITFEGTGIVLGKNKPEEKFRDAIKYRMNVVKDNITCEDSEGKRLISQCFKTQDGVVYGISDTDFKSVGVKKYNSEVEDNKEITCTTIVLYPTWENGYNFYENGYAINITSDGSMNFESNSEEKLKKIEEYITSTTIKRGDN